jgi:hypothetical protein
MHARIFLLGGFVSVENKECLIYFPKLVIRVRFPSPAPVCSVILNFNFTIDRNVLNVPIISQNSSDSYVSASSEETQAGKKDYV